MTADPTPEQAAEALAWLRENPETPDWLDAAGFSGEYIATVVRAALARDAAPGACCEYHTATCEPPSELCCERCTEAAHPGHADGSACVLARDADLAVVKQRVAAAMHLGLDDAAPNETPEDHAPWVERVQEWADFVHEQYAAALARDVPPAPAAGQHWRRALWRVRSELHWQRDGLPEDDPKTRTLAWALTMVDRVEREALARDVPAPTDEPPAGLPATLASVDDVRQVCETAGLQRLTGGSAPRAAWTDTDRTIGVAVAGIHDSDGVYSHVSGVGVLRLHDPDSDDADEVARIQLGAPTTLLWHALQAARSAP